MEMSKIPLGTLTSRQRENAGPFGTLSVSTNIYWRGDSTVLTIFTLLPEEVQVNTREQVFHSLAHV